MDSKQATTAVATRIFGKVKDFPSAEMVFVSDEYRILIPNMNVKIRIVSRNFGNYLQINVFTFVADKGPGLGPMNGYNLGNWTLLVQYTKKFSLRKIGARLAAVIYKRINANVKRSYRSLYVMEDSADLLR